MTVAATAATKIKLSGIPGQNKKKRVRGHFHESIVVKICLNLCLVQERVATVHSNGNEVPYCPTDVLVWDMRATSIPLCSPSADL